MKTFLSVFLVLLLITACASGPSKGQLDDDVRRLCAIDGGIKVYETVKLPAFRFEKDGSIYIPSKQIKKPKDKYYYESSDVFLSKGNPEMWQSHYKVYRASDKKIARREHCLYKAGGDIPGPWMETSFMCPEKAGTSHLMMQIFIKD